jgi:hypothetical protein
MDNGSLLAEAAAACAREVAAATYFSGACSNRRAHPAEQK